MKTQTILLKLLWFCVYNFKQVSKSGYLNKVTFEFNVKNKHTQKPMAYLGYTKN